MRGYPFGTFLYWKIDREHNKDYQFYEFVRNYHERDLPHCPKIGKMPNRDVTAVLDGQQRLTALNIGIHGSLAVKLPRKRWSNSDAFPTQRLYLDLLWTPADEDDVGMCYQFEFLTDKQAEERDGCWFPVPEILAMDDAGPALLRWLQTRGLDGGPLGKSHEVLYKLFDVVRNKSLVSFYEEKSQDLGMVLQIFIRTNSGGTFLSYSDLLLAVAVAQWVSHDAREEIHSLVDEVNKIGAGFDFSKDWILKAGLMLSDIGSVGFKVSNFNRKNMEILEKKWSGIKEILILTVELASNFGFNDTTLKADSALLPIAYYLYVKKVDRRYLTDQTFASDREAIRQWLISSFLKSGIWGSGLDSLLSALREVIRKDHSEFPTSEICATMRSRGKSLTFDDDEIDDLTEMRSGDKRTFSLLSLVFSHLDLRQHFHIDHVVPKSRATRDRFRAEGFSEDDARDLADRVDWLPNLQLLEGHENLQKRDTMPADWLRTNFNTDEESNSYAAIHLLDDVPETLKDFDAFYEARRQRLKAKLINLLKKLISD